MDVRAGAQRSRSGALRPRASVILEGVSVPEVAERTVTPRDTACEPTGTYWRRVRAATLWNADARSFGVPEGHTPCGRTIVAR